MRWRGREQSQNVEDRRGGGRHATAIGGGGCGVFIIAIIALMLGADQGLVMRLIGQGVQQQVANAPAQQQAGPVDDDTREFISVVLKDTETVWTRLFDEQVRGAQYAPPKLVIFSGQVRSGCGMASAQVGPFYCPADRQVYVDPTFFDQLASRHNASGDFAQAYVIAHEVGHHVQTLLGFSDIVNRVRMQGNKLESNRASVRLELQADFLAGVWAHHAHKEYNILEEGDIEEALNAAYQIGDDTLQRQAQGFVRPAHFTHGTSKQRVRWFRQGLASGDLDQCQALFEMDYDEL